MFNFGFKNQRRGVPTTGLIGKFLASNGLVDTIGVYAKTVPVVNMPSEQGAVYFVTQSGSGSGDGSSYDNSASVAAFNAGATPFDSLVGDTVYFCGSISSKIIPTHGGNDTANRVQLRFDHAIYPGVVDVAELESSCIDINSNSYIDLCCPVIKNSTDYNVYIHEDNVGRSIGIRVFRPTIDGGLNDGITAQDTSEVEYFDVVSLGVNDTAISGHDSATIVVNGITAENSQNVISCVGSVTLVFSDVVAGGTITREIIHTTLETGIGHSVTGTRFVVDGSSSDVEPVDFAALRGCNLSFGIVKHPPSGKFAFRFRSGNAKLSNSIVDGGGAKVGHAFFGNGATVDLYNCIAVGVNYVFGYIASATNCILNDYLTKTLAGGAVETGTIEDDPKFLAGSYYLASDSPAINAGADPFIDGDGNQYDALGGMVWSDDFDAPVYHARGGWFIGAYAPGCGSKVYNNPVLVSGSGLTGTYTLPICPTLLDADRDNTIYSALFVPNQIDLSTFIDTDWMRAGDKGWVIYDPAPDASLLPRIDRKIGN